MAVVSAVKHFHHYLYGTRFTIKTDHGSFRWLLNFKILDGQLARMLSQLYIQGLSQLIVDFCYETRLSIGNSMKCV